MNLFVIAWKSIRQRALASSLTSLSVALGVALMIAVLVINGIVSQTFNQSASGYDLIVGPKGSELQLVLNTIYRVSQPIENLPYRYYLQLKRDPRIADVVPIALGDVTQEGAFPIVGTIDRYFALEYVPGRKLRVRGHFFRGPFDAVIGARVARVNGWDLGTKFRLVHGGADSDHVHDELFEVVGVLEATGTPNDKTVFVDLEGFYHIQGHDKPLEEARAREREFYGGDPPPITDEDETTAGESGHGHHLDIAQKEVTALLVNMKSMVHVPLFQAELKEGFKAMAVRPLQQIKWLMDNIVGHVHTMLLVLSGLIVGVSGVSIFVSIYNSMSDRRREIAIMRALGAQRQTVFAIVLAESILLCVGGAAMGLLFGHGLVFVAAPIVEARSGFPLDPLTFDPLELVVLPTMIVLASLVGFIPALTAYRTDVARTLAD